MIYKFSCIIWMLCISLAFSYDWSSLDQLAKQAIKDRVTPSIVLSIANSKQILYMNSYGTLTYQHDMFQEIPSLDTIYDIASLSKIVGTLSVVQRLYDNKLLDVDDLVSKYVPQYANNGKQNTTIRNLLLHNAGLQPDYPGTLPDSKQKVLLYTYNCKLTNPVGKVFVYSDLSFIMLAEIVQRISKKDLNVIVKEITDQMKLNQTGYNPGEQLYYRIAPTEYSTYRQKLIRGIVHDPTAYLFGGIAGHAGVFSTVKDLTRFMMIHLNGGQLPGQARIFQKSTVDKFTTLQTKLPYQNTRALGWDTIPIQQNPPCGHKFSPNSFGHTGFTGTSIWADKDKDLIIVLLFNRVHPTAIYNRAIALRSQLSDEIVTILGY